MTVPEIEQGISAVDKIESQEVAREYNDFCKFRAIVYAKLMRKMIDAFGEDVLDIGEEVRRENGRYSGERSVDVIANERKYNQDPKILIREQDELWQSLSAAWSRTCPCFYDFRPRTGLSRTVQPVVHLRRRLPLGARRKNRDQLVLLGHGQYPYQPSPVLPVHAQAHA